MLFSKVTYNKYIFHKKQAKIHHWDRVKKKRPFSIPYLSIISVICQCYDKSSVKDKKDKGKNIQVQYLVSHCCAWLAGMFAVSSLATATESMYVFRALISRRCVLAVAWADL